MLHSMGGHPVSYVPDAADSVVIQYLSLTQMKRSDSEITQRCLLHEVLWLQSGKFVEVRFNLQ